MNKICIVALILTFWLGVSIGTTLGQEKIKITSADQLPRRNVELKGKALDILKDDAQLNRLADVLIKNYQNDLTKYDIQDKSTLDNYYSALVTLYSYQKDYDKALSYTSLARELQAKLAAKLTTGRFTEAYIAALKVNRDETSDEFKRAFEKNYSEIYAKLPYQDIGETVEGAIGSLTTQNKELVYGALESGLQPVLDKSNGVVPETVALQLISVKFTLEHRYPLRDQMLRVLTALYEANNKTVKKNDIWAARNVILARGDKLAPIVVAVWDSGVDMNTLPAENRFVNSSEQLNGKDDDGNGYVDDVHGIAYDLINYKKSVDALDDPIGKIKSDTKRLQQLMKGQLDLQSAIKSKEAAEFQQTIASLKREQVKDFSEEINFYAGYAHGTHVAGIIAEGNPAAKILAARMSFDYRILPQVPTIEKSKFTAQMYRDTIDYFKRNKVRIVNMSWGYDANEIEDALVANGVGKTPEERKAMARQMFEIERQALYEAVKNAPEILFVTSAGNSDSDVGFSDRIPKNFDLPNIITVGAVDSEGKKTAFTNEGKSVYLYANGYEVESFVPGGERLKFSGTSMASPNVANLAAKVLAVNPQLKPSELIKLIGDGAEASAESPKIKLINPQRTVGLLKQ